MASASGAYGRSNNFAVFPGFFMSRSQSPHETRGKLSPRKPPLSIVGCRERSCSAEKVRRATRYVARAAEKAAPGRGLEAGNRVELLLAAHLQRALLIDVGAA